ncbi:MAG: polysaccharide deacetylase family protein [Acidobacteria bacterium]|nr:polysaccharide deacetylase family protein [Acidobacteriota bacterium]
MLLLPLLPLSAAAAAWAVRGRSSQVFAPSVWRGPSSRRAVALTFDDGPSERTPELLELLARHGAAATFFQCGQNAARLPDLARAVARAGHAIGNHTYSHPGLWLRSAAFIDDEVGRAQRALTEIHSVAPHLFRAPYGVRWPGLAAAQRNHGLTSVMWSTMGRDWMAPAEEIARRLDRGTRPGAIFCLHDGRVLTPNPDLAPLLAALRTALPRWRDAGYEFLTVPALLWGKL